MKKFITGMIVGLLIALVAVWLMIPRLMILEKISPLGYKETVKLVKSNIEDGGWKVSSVMPLDIKFAKYGQTIPRTTLIKFCKPQYATEVLNAPSSQKLAVMMPCTIAVYEKTDGKTYLASMNMKLMGKMFGGKVAKIMGGSVAEEEEAFTDFMEK